MIYQSTRDGLNNQQYWNKVNGKGNLLMVFKSKSDYIFGAYSPCKWESYGGKYVEDNTLSSFIFSQTHDQVYPLRQDQKSNAIHCNSNSYGPLFGGGFDIRIDSNFTDGYCKLGYSYQFSQYKNQSEDPYLFGQNKPEIKESFDQDTINIIVVQQNDYDKKLDAIRRKKISLCFYYQIDQYIRYYQVLFLNHQNEKNQQ
ncbi:unnamed protein product [Paramecium primaurelia]|uniref:TLDc domain-containing protein n=1 Tax=Paramecium primaurelia TaxID=5886 RepID=A0A8S1QTW5_PARPR|nr:unnamed protein product [Paramecium primaurelia]